MPLIRKDPTGGHRLIITPFLSPYRRNQSGEVEYRPLYKVGDRIFDNLKTAEEYYDAVKHVQWEVEEWGI